jgi:acyl-CoA thioesterase-1
MSFTHHRANLCFLSLLIVSMIGCTDKPNQSAENTFTGEGITEEKAFRILILGDSLTEGYGVSPAQAFPSLLEKKLNSSSQTEHKFFEVINGGVTGSTTSGGVSRIGWHMQSPPDFLLVALGGNDGLRGIPPQESKQNLRKIIVSAQEHKVPVMLAGMKLPPNYGATHLEAFENMFPELADELKIPLLPFLLEGVGGNPKMNLPDRIHPNPQGHQMICQTVFQHLIKHLPKHLP